MFDVARVEVLKGPQGTLFGLTTSAGVINITTNAPDPTRSEAAFRTELSNAGTAGSKYGHQIVQAMINVPVGPRAALRVSGVTNLHQGVDRNAYTGHKRQRPLRRAARAACGSRATRLTVQSDRRLHGGRFNGGGDFFTFVHAGGPGILPLPTPFPIPDTGVANRALASCGVTSGEGNQRYCTRQIHPGAQL